MTNIDDGGPAFPADAKNLPQGGWNTNFQLGMSLRDWFAGMAMQSLIKIGAEAVKLDDNDNDVPSEAYYFGNWDHRDNGCEGVDALANDAYMVADAMIAERKKP